MSTISHPLTIAMLALALLAILGAFVSVQATEHKGDNAEMQDLAKLQQVVPVEQLITKARAKVSGRVYGVKFEDWPEGTKSTANEQYIYEIQILGSDNKLHELAYDASTGQFVGDHSEANEEEDEDDD